MPNDKRDPETFLKLAKAEELSSGGKLKIFLGYSAGVGKTYAMLEAARRLQRDGVDVAIGLVETHKRAETQALLEGLEIVPRKQLPYRNVVLEEMDLDAVIRRKPKVALVDELAHTNAPGSRHVKRHQDIEELLNEGIDVYTTLNIQHLESLNDIVAKATGVSMRETVPDSVLDEASEIEVVDIPISELLKRLREGRVYMPEAAERAMQNFFGEGNLTALREMTLRRAAKRIDTQMKELMERRVGPSRAMGERLLVSVSPYPSSAELVRSGKLLAAGLDAEWYAVYVETSGRAGLSPVAKDQLARTLKLAEELGAKAVTLTGHSVAEEIVNYARRQGVSKILVGKPLKRKWTDALFGTVVDRLIRRSGDIDVYAVNRSVQERGASVSSGEKRHSEWRDYALSLLVVAGATVLGLFTRTVFEATNLVMYYLAAVVVSAIYFGRGPSVLAATVSVALFDFLFIPPYFTFAVTDTQYLFTFLVLFVTSLVISTLTARIREQAESARERESHTSSLYGLSRDLASVREKKAVCHSLMRHVRETLGAEAAIFAREEKSLKLEEKSSGFEANDHENAVADWVFRNGQPAGRGTDTLPGAAGYYVPMKTGDGIYGTLGVLFKGGSSNISLENKRLLESFAGQTAASLERIDFSEEAQRTKLLEEKEKLQSALFNSISHDIRTPLVSITGALSGMLERPEMDDASRRDLLETSYEEAGRLNRLVGNLLDMARLEAQALKVTPVPCELRDVIGSALKELDERLKDRKVTVRIEERLPHIPMDFGLIMKVLVNLIDNAIKFAPFGLPIEIEAKRNGNRIDIRVLDRGLGIPEGDLEHVFGKFYRVKRPQNIEGTGLGLSICKGIVEAHGGTIRAENRPGGGAIVTVSLPVKP